MVEVDLRLFVTCRLCLDVQGHFQIDPTVQQHIKYCFDIDIEPFDGLPQLICKKCENILRAHYALKKNFTDKQKELKTKLQDTAKKDNKSPDSYVVIKTKSNSISSRLNDSDSSDVKDDYQGYILRKRKKVKKKRILNRLLSSSGDDSEPNDTSQAQVNVHVKEHSYSEDPETWNENYNQYFVCRICSQEFQDKDGITNHMKKHSILRMKYKNIFKTSCLVVMQKSDNKPNSLTSNKAVVYSPDTIIQNKHNPHYYIKYYPKTYSDIPSTFKSISKNNSSSSESINTELLPRKRRRLVSRSSSETVVINRHSELEDSSHIKDCNDPPTVIDCIDLGDSSDNGSYESNEKYCGSTNNRKLNSKPMHDIIKICHNKYTKQLDSLEQNATQNDKGKGDLLQRKVLSIGRKIINNKGFNCTGLLRYLEYKDLSVVWKETSVINARNDGKYVRIATQVRGNESIDMNNTGWVNFYSFQFENDNNFNSINILKKLKTFRNFKKKIKMNSAVYAEENMNSVENLPRISSVFSQTDLEITKTDSDNNLLLQKLLNKNPVSNPKQLPKKANSIESYQKNMKVFSAPNTVPIAGAKQIELNNEVTNTMPIVTSTVSLANLCDKQKDPPVEDTIIQSNNQQTYPRIKVKPVSELMPDKKTTNAISNDTFVNGAQNEPQISNVIWSNQNDTFNNQQTWPCQSNSIVIMNNSMWQKQTDSLNKTQVWPGQTTPLSDSNSINNVSQRSSKEYVLLDTVEFPNTKTRSPFQYFKYLLLVHNITLIDADQPLPEGSRSLINLKIVYQQEKCESVTLCVTLFGIKNLFSIHIKDTKSKFVSINTLSAHWQWQLLKIYNNDVTTKVLQSAAKVSSETYQYTQQFLTLLQSINLRYDIT